MAANFVEREGGCCTGTGGGKMGFEGGGGFLSSSSRKVNVVILPYVVRRDHGKICLFSFYPTAPFFVLIKKRPPGPPPE